MNLLLVGGSHKTIPIELREKLAFDGPKLVAALNELTNRFECESAIVNTCNRVEIYIARAEKEKVSEKKGPDTFSADLIAEFVGQFHQVPCEQFRASLYAKINE